MTATNSTINNPSLLGGPAGPMAHAYAAYLVKFFEAYKSEHGVDFWAVTAGNEPAGNTGKWQDLKFTATEQRDFIRCYRCGRYRCGRYCTHACDYSYTYFFTGS